MSLVRTKASHRWQWRMQGKVMFTTTLLLPLFLPSNAPGQKTSIIFMTVILDWVCWVQGNLLLLLLSCCICCKIDFILCWTTTQRQASRQTGWLAYYKGRQAPRSHLIHKKKDHYIENVWAMRRPTTGLQDSCWQRAEQQLRDYSERWMEMNGFNIDWAVRQWSICTVNEMSWGLGGSDKG